MDMLEDIMNSTVNFSRVAVTLAIWAGASQTAVAQSQGGITVGANVQISSARGDATHLESLLATDPLNADRLLATSHVDYPNGKAYSSIVYASFDGGKTWIVSHDTRDSTSGGDPAVAYGPDGSALFATLGKVTMYRSRDGGRTWDKPTKYPQFVGLDREYLVADFNKASKYYGRVYMNGTIFPAGSAVAIYTSTDGGTTWANPTFKAISQPKHILGMANSVILSDGSLVTLFGILTQGTSVGDDQMQSPSATLDVTISRDGGESIAEMVEIAPYWMNRPRSEGAVIPWIAVDPGSALFKDRLYVTWSDFQSGRLEIMMSYSSDKGKTWSQPLVLNDDRTPIDPSKGPDAINPVVAVNKDGVVAVSWYDRRESGDNLGWQLRVRASLDGGETWLPSTKVSEAPTTFGSEEWSLHGGAYVSGDTGKSGGSHLSISASHWNFWFSPGHTSGFAAAADGRFHAVWVDNRTGVAQLWTAPITVTGTVARHGGGDLASLADLGGTLSLETVEQRHDRVNNRLILKVRVKNITKDTVKFDVVKIRALSFNSDIAVVQAGNADNGVPGPGAVWDLSSTIPATGLLPDSLGTIKELIFQLSDIRPFRQGSKNRFRILSMNGQLLGQRKPKV